MWKQMLYAGVVASVSDVASAQVFFERDSWVSAAGGDVTSPDFSTVAPTTFADGVATDLGGFFTVTANGDDATLNGVPNFVFDFLPDGLQTVTFTFDTPITAFAAIWSNSFVQDGFSVSSESETYDLNALIDPLDDTFIGFVEASGFSTVTFSATPVGGDDFVFFTSFEFVVVPAPASAGVLVVGGLVAMRRRR